MLPVCSGGCPDLKLHFNEESKCEQVKYYISNIMKYYKNSKKGDKVKWI
jgi:sulfatase maturation enzyme AslB (radical SAM superfamily)